MCRERAQLGVRLLRGAVRDACAITSAWRDESADDDIVRVLSLRLELSDGRVGVALREQRLVPNERIARARDGDRRAVP